MQMQTIQTTQLVHAVTKNAKFWLILFMGTIFSIEWIEDLHSKAMVHRGDGYLVHWDWVLLIPSAILWLWSEYAHKRGWARIAAVLFCGAGPTLFIGCLFRNVHQIEGHANLVLVLLFLSAVCFGLYMKAKIDSSWD